MTPFEKAERLAKALKLSLEINNALEEIALLPPEQQDTPETQAVIEVLCLALFAVGSNEKMEA